jgi:predicted nucleotidyltransferase
VSNTSSPFSVSRRRPVDPLIVGILREVDRIISTVGMRYFVAGATGRDVILENVFERSTARATKDVGFGIAVRDWEDYQRLKNRFVQSGKFVESTKCQQRLMYQFNPDTESPVDFIPFGGVERTDFVIAWPPEMDPVMNVIGFADVLASSVKVQIDETLTVPVASIPGLALLKLMAWADRRDSTAKDASDLLYLLKNYADAGNLDRLYDSQFHLVREAEFDVEIAGARLLGQDAALICGKPLASRVSALLNSAGQIQRLIGHMSQSESIDFEGARAQVARLVSAFGEVFFRTIENV